jgi:acyl-CoA reductase-like NAD-dependent aldehyde dehydrogenase
MQYEVIQKLITDSREERHRFALGENQPSHSGLFISPVIIDRPPDSAALVQKEQFGTMPLLFVPNKEQF